MSLTKVALVTLLIIIILAIGQPLSTVHQRRCYSCRWTFWKPFIWNNVNLETGLVVHLGIAATNLWLTIIRVRWIKQFSKLSKNYRMECTRWLKNRAHQAGALSKRKGRIQRFVLYSPLNSKSRKSFKIQLSNNDPGRDGDRAKLPCEETKRLEGEMRGGGIFLFFEIEMMKVKRELRRE